MPRARNIKPGFFTNDDLVELDFATRLLFIGLWTLADREGRLEDRPKRIKMAIFPADDVNVDQALSDLAVAGFIVRYQVGDVSAIQILNFLKHQKPHQRESPSQLPPYWGGAEAQPRNDQGTTKAMPSRAESLLSDSLNADVPAEHDPGDAGVESVVAARGTLAGKACKAMRDAGVAAVNPSDPDLSQLLSTGVTPTQLGDLARELSESKGSPPKFRYVIATMAGRLRDAATQANAPPINGRRLPYPAEFVGWERDDQKALALSRHLGMGDGGSGDSWQTLRGKLRVKIEQIARVAA